MSVNCSDKSNVDSDTNQYVKFTRASLEANAGQATVPFWDAQKVEPTPTLPLSGVGLFHKGAPKCGGFLGLRIFSMDYSEYMGEPARR